MDNFNRRSVDVYGKVENLKQEEQERTFILVKPDGVKRRLIGEVIQRFENKGLKLINMKFVMPTEDLIREMYKEERHAIYFDKLLYALTHGPVVPMIWQGVDAVGIGRRIVSEAITEFAPPGTIRGDCCLHVGRNVVHGAEDKDEAEMDIDIWFKK